MTTTSERLKKITPVINSLLEQTVKVDLISITVPYGDKYKIPTKIIDGVSLLRTGQDYGELNALIPVVLKEGDNNTHIITVKDNKIYGIDFVDILIQNSLKYPNSIIYTNKKDILDGALFKPKFFDDNIIYLKNTEQILKNKNVPIKYFKYRENYKSIN